MRRRRTTRTSSNTNRCRTSGAEKIQTRSRFEARIAAQLAASGVEWGYEDRVLTYERPASRHRYTPDFTFGTRLLVIEAKGYLSREDRQKLVLVKQSNPEIDLRLVFQRATNPIYPGSKTTYAMWADKVGIPWAEGEVPSNWLA